MLLLMMFPICWTNTSQKERSFNDYGGRFFCECDYVFYIFMNDDLEDILFVKSKNKTKCLRCDHLEL